MSQTTVYWMPESPPCRSVYVVAKILGIKDQIEWKPLDLSKQEQLAPEFLAINPFHTVPTLAEADGFNLFESRAICQYLVQKTKDSHLYPVADLKRRAMIDQTLQLDLGTIYRNMSEVIYPIFRTGKPDMEKLPTFYEKLDLFEKFLEHIKVGKYFFGDELSLADISTYHTLVMIESIPEIMSLSKYPKISAWFKNMTDFMKQLDENDGTLTKAQQNLCGYVQSMIAKHKQA